MGQLANETGEPHWRRKRLTIYKHARREDEVLIQVAEYWISADEVTLMRLLAYVPKDGIFECNIASTITGHQTPRLTLSSIYP